MTKELKLPVAWMPTRPNRNSPTKLPSTPRTALRANDVSVPIKRPAMYPARAPTSTPMTSEASSPTRENRPIKQPTKAQMSAMTIRIESVIIMRPPI